MFPIYDKSLEPSPGKKAKFLGLDIVEREIPPAHPLCLEHAWQAWLTRKVLSKAEPVQLLFVLPVS